MVYGNAIKVSLLPYAVLRDLTLCVPKAIIHEKVCLVQSSGSVLELITRDSLATVSCR